MRKYWATIAIISATAVSLSGCSATPSPRIDKEVDERMATSILNAVPKTSAATSKAPQPQQGSDGDQPDNVAPLVRQNYVLEGTEIVLYGDSDPESYAAVLTPDDSIKWARFLQKKFEADPTTLIALRARVLGSRTELMFANPNVDLPAQWEKFAPHADAYAGFDAVHVFRGDENSLLNPTHISTSDSVAECVAQFRKIANGLAQLPKELEFNYQVETSLGRCGVKNTDIAYWLYAGQTAVIDKTLDVIERSDPTDVFQIVHIDAVNGKLFADPHAGMQVDDIFVADLLQAAKDGISGNPGTGPKTMVYYRLNPAAASN